MNTEYLNTLPEQANCHNVELEADEKVVFTAKMPTFGTEHGQALGTADSKFTLTNKRVLADNGVGLWIVDLLQDVTDCAIVEKKGWIFKYTYWLVNMDKEVFYGNGRQKLTGFRFYFKEGDLEKLAQIVSHL